MPDTVRTCSVTGARELCLSSCVRRAPAKIARFGTTDVGDTLTKGSKHDNQETSSFSLGVQCTADSVSLPIMGLPK